MASVLWLIIAVIIVWSAVQMAGGLLTAGGESPTAFDRRCIPAPPHGAQSAPWGPRADCVAPPSNIPDILGRRALSAGRLAALGATLDFHHGLLAGPMPWVVADCTYFLR